MLYKKILAFTAILRCSRKIRSAPPDPNQIFVEFAVVLRRSVQHFSAFVVIFDDLKNEYACLNMPLEQ